MTAAWCRACNRVEGRQYMGGYERCPWCFSYDLEWGPDGGPDPRWPQDDETDISQGPGIDWAMILEVYVPVDAEGEPNYLLD